MVPVETGERTKPEQETLDSGNVFADMGLTQPAQELLKAGLTFEIYSIIQQRGLTQAEAARILSVQ
jgi:predicted XRE-type DNA-binding protein